MIYLLTEYVDYDSETPLLVTDDLEAAKAGIPEGYPNADAFIIYECEIGQKPRGLLAAETRLTMDRGMIVGEWEPY